MTTISPAVQSVLDLFQGPLREVRFADIDAAGLATLAAEVETAASEVQRQEEALGELKHGLAQRHEALLGLAQQALAYAKVYAENDEALLDELNRISLPRAAKPRKAGAAKSSAKAEPSTLDAAAAVADATQSADAVEASESAGEAVSVEASDATPTHDGRSSSRGSARAKGRGAAAQRAMS